MNLVKKILLILKLIWYPFLITGILQFHPPNLFGEIGEGRERRSRRDGSLDLRI